MEVQDYASKTVERRGRRPDSGRRLKIMSLRPPPRAVSRRWPPRAQAARSRGIDEMSRLGGQRRGDREAVGDRQQSPRRRVELGNGSNSGRAGLRLLIGIFMPTARAGGDRASSPHFFF